MAGIADRLGVCSLKQKFCLIVIKQGFLPLPGGMTAVAVIAKCLSMNVVSFVTVNTAAWRIPELFTVHMTGIAGNGLVATGELEVGESMVKGAAVQAGNIDRSTDVVGMAAATFGIPYGSGSPMKAGFIGKITINIFMAIQAQGRLFFLVKQAVAFSTAAFVFRVPLDHRTRHDQRLEHVRFYRVGVASGK